MVDSRALVREGLCAVLAAFDDMEFVGETGSLAEVEGAVRMGCPDVVLMEVGVALAEDAGVIHRILTASNDVKVLLLGETDDRECLLRGLRAGACGYIPTKATASELVSAIRTVRRGDFFLYPSAARALVVEYLRVGRNVSPYLYDQLNRRQQAVLRLLSQGNNNGQIAESLNISLSTVQWNRARIMAKLGANNRTELLRFAIRKNLTAVES